MTSVTKLIPETKGAKVMSGPADVHRSSLIDLMRGICVLLVVLHHIDLRFRIKQFDVSWLAPEPVRQILFDSGYFAVVSFFVISGFLITTLSRSRWASLDRIEIGQFYWLRFARIVPCLVLLIALLSCLHLLQITEFVIKPERATLGKAVFAASTFHINWLEGHQGYLPGTWDILWSLSVEEMFYLVFPLACFLIRRERWLLVPLLALIVIGPYNRWALAGQDPWSDYAYLSCADGLAFGCLAAFLGARLTIRTSLARVLMGIGISCVLLIVVFRETTLELGVGREIGISILASGVALILFSMKQGVGKTSSLPGTRIIQFVGQSSYEIYLTHMLVVLGLIPLMVSLQPRASIPLWYALLIAISVLLGAVLRSTFSEPLNKALRSGGVRLAKAVA